MGRVSQARGEPRHRARYPDAIGQQRCPSIVDGRLDDGVDLQAAP
jgi:hypothetical protein